MDGFSAMCEPLRQLTKEDVAWDWNFEQETAFQKIKESLVKAPVLAFFDERQDTTLQCDASQTALGAALLQNGRPVAYTSRALSAAECNYAQIEKELLAVVFGMEHFDHFTYGREIRVESDHKPLQAIMGKPLMDAPRRLQRMLLRLQRYRLSLTFKPGKDMLVADTLSRAPVPSQQGTTLAQKEFETICAIQDATDVDPILQEVREETKSDNTLQQVMQFIASGWPDKKSDLPPQTVPFHSFRDELISEAGVIYKRERVVIPKNLRRKTLGQLHSAHMGLQATIRRARETIFWPHMNSDIKNLLDSCETCKSFEPQQAKQPLKNHEVIDQRWAKLGADLFHHDGNDYLITVDYLTNFWEVDNLNHDLTALSIIYKLRQQFARHGTPVELVTDNGPQFVSEQFEAFSQRWGFVHTTTSPYHPRSNGKVESAVKTAKGLMRKAAHSGADVWLGVLEYRNTPTQGFDSSPAERLFSRRTRTILPAKPSTLQAKVQEATASKLCHSQEVQAKAYNRGSKELRDLKVGDIVTIKLQAKWQEAMVIRPSGKSGRSYVVRTKATGKFYRRNRRDLRLQRSTLMHHEEMTNNWDEKQEDQPAAEGEVEEEEEPRIENEETPSPQAQLLQRTTRSGRVVKPPVYLKDYDCSS